MKACCIGCNVPSVWASPSMVVTWRPWTETASVRHDSTRRVNEDRASTALAVIAAFLRPGEPDMFAQRIEHGRAHIECQPMFLVVDCKGDIDGIAGIFGPLRRRSRLRRQRARHEGAGSGRCGHTHEKVSAVKWSARTQ